MNVVDDMSLEVIAQRYQLGALLGRGGMGDVRAGTDLALDRVVAVKFLRPELAGLPGIRIRFEREARAAARITHPNVVAIFDIGEHDGLPYIVMERLSGRTMADEMAAGPLSVPRACALAVETLAALEAAHRLGVIHRDIKPGNILLTPEAHAKVADFGIAKLAEEMDQTATGSIIGTARYLAPERLTGKPASPAADLYAVGVVLYEALTGRPAFDADTPLALIAVIADGIPVPLATVRPDLAPALVEVVDRATSVLPEDRFSSAAAMSDALQDVITRVAPSRFLTPTVPEARPVVAPTAVLPRANVADTAPARATRRRRSARGRGFILAAIFLVSAVVAVGALMISNRDDSPGPAVPTSTTGLDRSIPAPLRSAIDALDRAVRP